MKKSISLVVAPCALFLLPLLGFTGEYNGRTVGRVFVAGMDANAEMVRRGTAWVYRAYAKDAMLFKLEAEARRDKRGLRSFRESERIPPWEWRREKRANHS